MPTVTVVIPIIRCVGHQNIVKNKNRHLLAFFHLWVEKFSHPHHQLRPSRRVPSQPYPACDIRYYDGEDGGKVGDDAVHRNASRESVEPVERAMR